MKMSQKKYLNPSENKAVDEFVIKLKTLLQEELIKIRLFGSKARSVTNGESDIDILIVLKNKNLNILNQIIDILVDIQLKYDANISPVIYTEYEFKMNLEMGSFFIKNVEKEGIPL